MFVKMCERYMFTHTCLHMHTSFSDNVHERACVLACMYMHATLSIVDAKYTTQLYVTNNVCTFNGGKLKFFMDWSASD